MSDEQKLVKNVSFSNIVDVTLVPERTEYKDANLNNLLWWKDEDIIKFRKECALEIKTVLSFFRLFVEHLLNSYKIIATECERFNEG